MENKDVICAEKEEKVRKAIKRKIVFLLNDISERLSESIANEFGSRDELEEFLEEITGAPSSEYLAGYYEGQLEMLYEIMREMVGEVI